MPARERPFSRATSRRPVTGMLTCAECGCRSDSLAKGWSAFQGTHSDGIQPDDVSVYCPVCAAREFGFRPELAEKYVCVWEASGQAGDIL